MKIQVKLILLLSAITALFLAVLLVFNYSEQESLNFLLEDIKNEKISLFNKVLNLKGENLVSFIDYYLENDDFINALANEDSKILVELLNNIEEYSNLNYIGIFNNNFDILYSSTTKIEELNQISQIFDSLKNKNTAHFFIYSNNQISEYRYSKISSPYSEENLGYILSGRLWATPPKS